MGDLEYTSHPHSTLLGDEEEDNTRQETQELTLKVPTSRGESPITTPLVGISYNCPAFSESAQYQCVQL